LEVRKFMTLLDISRRARALLRRSVVLVTGVALSACVAPPPRVAVVPAPPPPPPQRIFVYPNNGQTPQQTDRDRYECHVWAVQQTGVDPSRPNASPYERVVVQPTAPPGTGTAVGAVGGAILGSLIAGPRNAGAGFVLGAATGAIVGTAADANAQAQAQAQARQTQAQINQAAAEGRARADSYRRALGACLQGRGYTVT
jgi:Glycine zipper 2TM domain